MKFSFLLFFLFSMRISFAQDINRTESRVLINEHSITSDYLNPEVSYNIYLPDAYEVELNKRFPVIYWFHGSGGWPLGAREMLAERFDMAIKTKQIPPAIVVFLDDGKRESMWVDSKDGSVKMESIIINELIPHIDDTYRTINYSRGRILEGGSMGGYGSARLGLKYPDLFSAISLINPGPMQKVLVPKEAPLESAEKAQKVLDRVYGGDVEYFYQLSPWSIAKKNTKKIENRLGIRIIVGGLDPSMSNVKLFSEHLDKLELKHELTILDNAGHSPKSMFSALGNQYWEFFNHYLSKARE